jgi:hypothetical protein
MTIRDYIKRRQRDAPKRVSSSPIRRRRLQASATLPLSDSGIHRANYPMQAKALKIETQTGGLPETRKAASSGQGPQSPNCLAIPRRRSRPSEPLGFGWRGLSGEKLRMGGS